MFRWFALIIALIVIAFSPLSCQQTGIKIGSKKFTESVILGEILTHSIRAEGVVTTHFQELGGSQLVFKALLSGDIDLYPEYTGTIVEEILAGFSIGADSELRSTLGEQGVLMSRPLGFNNSYAIGMLRDQAQLLKIDKISDLRRHPELRLGFSNEFMDRQDGWKGMQRHYGLRQQTAKGLDHDLAYRQLALGALDAIDVYTTDAKIQLLDLKVLEDDLAYFPRYDAVVLYRADLPDRSPEAVKRISLLESKITEAEMIRLNSGTVIDGDSENRVAIEFLRDRFGLILEAPEETVPARIWKRTLEHLDLVRKSLIPAILIAIPLGILAVKLPRLGRVVIASVGIVQTIPALALLVILLPAVAVLGLQGIGVGSATAVLALFLYSLLPIVRNTHAGLQGIENHYLESAIALGLPPRYRLLWIELPLASRSILAGIKTAAVINVGFATLGALIGAGGYGQPILTGIRLADTSLILQGAVPAALLALLIQSLFELAERQLVPKGLMLSRS
jgi:osmoprotectant transport system permease protein